MGKAGTAPVSPRSLSDDADAATSAAQATIEQLAPPVLENAPAFRHEYGATFSGWLWKPGRKVASVKRKRFFRLDGAVLSKHESADPREPALWHMNVQGSTLSTIGKVGFQLAVHDPAVKEAASPISLYVRTPAEQDKWVAALSGAINRKLSHFYKEMSPIGEGGFAVVRRGFDRRTNEPVAIKTITKKRAHLKLYGREIAILKCVQHPAVVRTLDIFETKDKVHVVMELCEGGMLYSAVQDGVEFEEAHVAMLMRQIFAGVAYLHASGICHRDLKPENVLCDSSVSPRVVKIADFGLSNVFGPQDSMMSTLIGTPEFIAPEIAMRQSYGPAVDVWATGMIMYNVVAGNLPFEEEGDAVIGRLRHELQINFPEPVWRRYSPAARSFVRATLQRDPAKRLTAQAALVHPWLDNAAAAAVVASAAPPVMLPPPQAASSGGLPPTSPNRSSASPRQSAFSVERRAAGRLSKLKSRLLAAVHAVRVYRRLVLLGMPDGALRIHEPVPRTPPKLDVTVDPVLGSRSVSVDNAHLAEAFAAWDLDGVSNNQIEIDEDFALDMEDAGAADSDDPSSDTEKRSVRSFRALMGGSAGGSKRDASTSSSLSRSSSRGLQPNSSFSSLFSSVKNKLYTPTMSRSHSRQVPLPDEGGGGALALASPRGGAVASTPVSPRVDSSASSSAASIGGAGTALVADAPTRTRPLDWSGQSGTGVARVSDAPDAERIAISPLSKSTVRTTVRSKLTKAFADSPSRRHGAESSASNSRGLVAAVAADEALSSSTPWGAPLASLPTKVVRAGSSDLDEDFPAADHDPPGLGVVGHDLNSLSSSLSPTGSVASPGSSVGTLEEQITSLPARIFRQLHLSEHPKVGRSTSAHGEEALGGGGGGVSPPSPSPPSSRTPPTKPTRRRCGIWRTSPPGPPVTRRRSPPSTPPPSAAGVTSTWTRRPGTACGRRGFWGGGRAVATRAGTARMGTPTCPSGGELGGGGREVGGADGWWLGTGRLRVATGGVPCQQGVAAGTAGEAPTGGRGRCDRDTRSCGSRQSWLCMVLVGTRATTKQVSC